MNSEEIRDLAIETLDDLQAIDINSINVQSLTAITDYMIICTGRSNRHLKALADSVTAKAKEHHLKFVKREGDTDSEWILVDLGDIVVHIMLPNAREFYALEDLWEPVEALRQSKGS